jgi:alkylation response protein AidB-like acyl-CoA dehydrogenase
MPLLPLPLSFSLSLALSAQILEGTNEIMRLIVSREVLRD